MGHTQKRQENTECTQTNTVQYTRRKKQVHKFVNGNIINVKLR